MSDIHIAGTGIWYPEDKIYNFEMVKSYNKYVERFNINNIENYLSKLYKPTTFNNIYKFIE